MLKFPLPRSLYYSVQFTPADPQGELNSFNFHINFILFYKS